MSEADLKRVAVEAVRQQLELSEKTRVKTSVANAVAICVTIIGATWAASWGIQNYLHDIRDGQSRIEMALSYKVSVSQFAAWANQLERANRTTVPTLIVPDTPQSK